MGELESEEKIFFKYRFLLFSWRGCISRVHGADFEASPFMWLAWLSAV